MVVFDTTFNKKEVYYMAKRFISILLMLAILLHSEVCLGEQLPGLSTARIIELQELAGENGSQWIEARRLRRT